MSKGAWFWALITLLLGLAHQVAYRGAIALDPLVPIELWIFGQSLWGVLGLGLWAQYFQIPLTLSSSRDLRFFLYRGILAILGQVLFLYALKTLPLVLLAYSTYIGLCATTFGSMLFLEKKVSISALVALAFCLIGIFCADPSGIPQGLYYAPLLSTLCFSGSSLLTKSLSATYSPFQVVFYLLLSMTVGLGVWLFWSNPFALLFLGRVDLIALTIGLSLIYLSLHLSMTKSYQLAPLSLIALTKPLKIPLAALADRAIYARELLPQECIGGLWILAAMILLDHARYIAAVPMRIKQSLWRTKALS